MRPSADSARLLADLASIMVVVGTASVVVCGAVVVYMLWRKVKGMPR